MTDTVPTYSATSHRFVAVLNKKCDVGRLFNVLGHMAAGLTALHRDNLQELNFTEYRDLDGNIHPSISDNPFIVLKSDNSNKLRALRQELIDQNIKFASFTDTMIGSSAQAQHQLTLQTSEDKLEYYGICFFGESGIAKELTKKFSVFN